ncbi:AAA family ATPase [Janibacter melonis]|uniref:Nuclease SbcCD subunit C n=1 Tax=Janibacter melonis TaxID=262209 RepID=A0A650GEQ1_9MICO|nr:SMC family ATPase [Janibacter melonis]QGX08342.1 AAA family ATPase [Janibacter melonis]
MRLHRLEVEAFGPFASRQVVDFDALGQTGLFLITGPTGSGKTSLLDAISFALFGQLPGVRGAKALHSQHADPSTPPEVLLEVTLSGRRLRITRRPAFERPGRKTPVQAAIVLDEHLGGRWTTLTQRLDEAGRVMEDALGMTREQFHRVVVLPQGDFASFLHASSDDRGDLLRRLFDVETYAGVQDWLLEERRRVEQVDRDAARDLDRLREEAVPLLASGPGGGDEPAVGAGADYPEPTGAATADGTLSQLDAAGLADLLARTQQAAESEHTESAAAVELAEAALRQHEHQARLAHQQAASHDRGTQAVVARDELLARADEHDAASRSLARSAAARRALGALPALTRAQEDLRRAHEQTSTARAALPPLAPAARDDLERWVADVAGASADVASAQHEARSLVGRLDRQPGLVDERERAAADLAAVAPARDALHAELEAAQQSRDAAAAAAAELETITTRAARLRRALDVRRRLDDVRGRALPAAADVVRDARDRAQDARQRYLDLFQARLDGMAGELAAALVEDAPCAVCGSTAHPAPAATGELVEPVAVERALTASTLAADALAEAQGRQTEVEVEVAALVATLGEEVREADKIAVDLEQTEAAARACSEHAREAERLGRAVTGLVTRLERLAGEEDRLVQALTAATTRHDTGLAALVASHDDVVSSLAAHAAGCPCGAVSPAGSSSGVDAAAERAGDLVLDDLLVHRVETTVRAAVQVAQEHERHLRAGERLLSALDAHDAATGRHDSAAAELARALEAEGLTDVDEAHSHLLQAEQVAGLERAVASYASRLAAARAVLDEPEVVAALASARPDVEAVDEQAQHARSRWTEATHRTAELSQVVGALRSAARRARALAQTSGDLASRRDLVTSVADLTSGRGPHNPDGVSLTTYVLAARLERIVFIANERLDAMVTGRYELAVDHGRGGDRRRRGGLGLLVHDRWSGETRAATTLSGGETFMVSLALALGTADAVREESGGSELETLFVDEGFGSLDDDALEEVMAVLDELRAGGRAVGVISHVADMRHRIPTQLTVTRRVDGSSVSVVEDADAA